MRPNGKLLPAALAAAGLALAAWWARPNGLPDGAALIADEGGPSRAAVAEPTVVCRDAQAADQDERSPIPVHWDWSLGLCIWVHPDDPGRSTVIASDKAAQRLFVYDLAGKTIQTVRAAHPGNIDLRYDVALGGGKVDVVAFNERSGAPRVRVFAVDKATGRLRGLQSRYSGIGASIGASAGPEGIDNGAIRTGSNYGGTLFRSGKTGKLYFLTTSVSGRVEQYELFDDGAGKVGGRRVRTWTVGLCEGAVGCDQTGMVYVAGEGKGVWEVGGEPTDPTPGRLIARVGENGLRADVEGLTIYPAAPPSGQALLLVSSQGSNNFKVYRLGGPSAARGEPAFLGTFAVKGAADTDGIDVTSAALGRAFPKGMFACHTDVARGGGRPILLTPWERIAQSLTPPLPIDTSRGPRSK